MRVQFFSVSVSASVWVRLLGLGVSVGVSALWASMARADVPADPTGPILDYASPPAGPLPGPPACSFRHPVCMHAALGRPGDPPWALAAIGAADRAWDVMTGALALPPPDTELDGAWHVYAVDGVDRVPGGGRALLEGRDPRARYDRATSFGLIDREAAPGCALDLELARAVAQAILLGAAPATDEGSARAQVEALVRLATPCGDAQGAAMADAIEFQSHPERTLVDPSSFSFDRGASLFFEWLDATRAREPAGLIGAVWALAPTRSPWEAWRWAGAPTAFDVLRASLGGAASERAALDDLFVRFAVARAQATPPVSVAWRVPWPDRPRRLASPEPVSPTGASYVLVDHAGASPGAKLRLEAQWEDYGRMRWVAVKIDGAGRPYATLDVTSLERGTQASLTIESLDAASRVLIVGVNVGSTEHPFNPDQGEWEPHGWLLTIESL
jgi:hypothetical protein